jgi:3-hydroxyisobutyrate dehydrogenase-like beta-hydroxyacid dehydrogenase
METIGLIGVGLLGSAIAERLLGAGFGVRGYDRDPARLAALEALGGAAVRSAEEAAGDAQAVITCLPDGSTVREAVAPLLAAEVTPATLIDMTTCAPAEAVALAQMLAARGIECLDAAVSGSSAQVRGGQGTLLVGGEADTFVRCEAILRAIAPRAHHLGGHGAGATAKLVTNLILGLNRFALAEGLNLGLAAGLEGGRLLAVLKDSAAYSRVMDTKGGKMLAGDVAPEARLRQHLKDVRLIVEMARESGTTTPLEARHLELLEQAVADGWGDADNSAIVAWLRERR